MKPIQNIYGRVRPKPFCSQMICCCINGQKWAIKEEGKMAEVFGRGGVMGCMPRTIVDH